VLDDIHGIERAYDLLAAATGKVGPKTLQRNGELRVRCPDKDHADKHASCDLDLEADRWICRTCPGRGRAGSGEAIIAELQSKENEPFDPRLLVLETELARVLAVNSRESSTSSMTIRQAWDGHNLENRRSKDKVVARIHHVSMLAHITPDELLARLTENDSTNGLRIVFCSSPRSARRCCRSAGVYRQRSSADTRRDCGLQLIEQAADG
jgi:hypothetical protein